MLNQLNTEFARAAVAGALVAMSGTTAMSETRIDNANSDMDSQFAIASKRYGGDKVEMHSRRENASGSTHSVHVFNCAERTFDTLYEGLDAPGDYSAATENSASQPIDNNTTVAPLARHACEKHGHSILLMEW